MVYTGISLSASTVGQKGAEIAIADTGCSIPQEDLKKLFDHFLLQKIWIRLPSLVFQFCLGSYRDTEE